MSRTNIALVLFSMYVMAFGLNVEMESKADLEQAAQLAMMDGENGVWYVRMFASNATDTTVKGPFSQAGLYPVASNTVKGTADTQAVVNSILTTGNPNPGLVQAPVLQKTVILPEAAKNPLLPVDYNAPIVPMTAEERKKFTPAFVLGVPDKEKDPEAYEEWKKQQEPFGYLGLDKVQTTKNITKTPITVKTDYNRTSVVAPVKVLENPSAYDGAVKPMSANDTKVYHEIPAFMEGVVPAEALPSVNPEIVAKSLDYYDGTLAANVAMPVPGAEAAAQIAAQTSLLEVDAEAETDMFVPMTIEDSETLALEAKQDAWNTLNAGVAALMEENLEHHDSTVAQLHQMSADVSMALGAQPSFMSLADNVEAESEEEIQGEVDAHHEMAHEHDISDQFAFVRSAGVLGRSVDVSEAEQDSMEVQLNDFLNTAEQALVEAGSEVENDESEDSEEGAALLDTGVDMDAEDAEEMDMDMDEEDTPAPAPATKASPVAKYYRARIAQLGFPAVHYTTPLWNAVHTLPYRRVTIGSTYVNPTPLAARILAERLYGLRQHLRAYRIARGLRVQKIAWRVQRFLNRLARASVRDRVHVARVLAAHHVVHRPHVSLLEFVKDLKEVAKEAKDTKEDTKEVAKKDDASKTVKESIKNLTKLPSKAEVKVAAKVAAKEDNKVVSSLKKKDAKLNDLVKKITKKNSTKTVSSSKNSTKAVKASKNSSVKDVKHAVKKTVKVAKKVVKAAAKEARKAVKKAKALVKKASSPAEKKEAKKALKEIKKAAVAKVTGAKVAAKAAVKSAKKQVVAVKEAKKEAKVAKKIEAKKEAKEAEKEAEKAESKSLLEADAEQEMEVDEGDELEQFLDDSLAVDDEEEAELDSHSADIGDITNLASQALAEDAVKPVSKEEQQLQQLPTVPSYIEASHESMSEDSEEAAPTNELEQIYMSLSY